MVLVFSMAYSLFEEIDQGIQELNKKNLWRTVFKKFEVHFKFFKDCLPQILLGPFLNTMTQIVLFRLLKRTLDLKLNDILTPEFLKSIRNIKK